MHSGVPRGSRLGKLARNKIEVDCIHSQGILVAGYVPATLFAVTMLYDGCITHHGIFWHVSDVGQPGPPGGAAEGPRSMH